MEIIIGGKTIIANDSSYRYREIKGIDTLTLHFSTSEPLDIAVGAEVEYNGERYYLMRPENLTMRNSRLYDYVGVFESAAGTLKNLLFHLPETMELRFPLTAKPREHLQMLVDNLNRFSGTWSIGECIDGEEKHIGYDFMTCWDALQAMADAFDTEFLIEGNKITLGKIERDADNPLPLSYGKGNGFLSGVKRVNESDESPIRYLYVKGGERNIDAASYGSKTLHLPKDGTKIIFEGKEYKVECNSSCVFGQLDNPFDFCEGAVDLSDIYPKREGAVSAAEEMNSDKHFWNFSDSSIPEDLDYSGYQIAGEKMTIIFQSGMLAGKEFEVHKYKHDTRTFELVPQDIDGQTMPNKTFAPRVGDKYAVFHCTLPQRYIDDAQQKMLVEAVKYLHEHETPRYSFVGKLDPIFAKKNWVNIGGRLNLGNYITFRADKWQEEPINIRITAVKEYINNPHSPEITLSNKVITASFSTALRNKEAEANVTEVSNYHDSINFTKRRFREAKETTELLAKAFGDKFSESINPLSIQSMQLLVGDERLQFDFVEDEYSSKRTALNMSWDKTTHTLKQSNYVWLRTAAIEERESNEHVMTAEGRFSYFEMARFTSGALDPKTAYYLVAHCDDEYGPSYFELVTEIPTTIIFKKDDHYVYKFPVGALTREDEQGERSFVEFYGFTEILPGRITTDRIVTTDGNSYLDLAQNSFKLGDKMKFNEDGKGQLILNGTLVQNANGDTSEIGVTRGAYKPINTYFKGDVVTYNVGGLTSSYRYINDAPSKGIVPTNTDYWEVLAQGSKGDSPSLVFRGEYDPKAEYYGNSRRVDCVHFGKTYYVANTDAGIFSNVVPTDSTKWANFGATFDSIATGLILADEAFLANFVFKDGKLYSQDGIKQGNVDLSKIMFDGVSGEARLGGFHFRDGEIELTKSKGSEIDWANFTATPDFFKIGSKGGFAMLGDNVTDSTAPYLREASYIVQKGGDNSYGTVNIGLRVNVSNARSVYGVYSNAPLLAPSFINTRGQRINITNGVMSAAINFSQHTIFFLYSNAKVRVNLPSKSDVLGFFQMASLPNDFAVRITLMVTDNRTQEIQIYGASNRNEVKEGYLLNLGNKDDWWALGGGQSMEILANNDSGKFNYNLISLNR